jgi:predicted DNA binding protein
MYEISVEFGHHCTISDLSARFPSANFQFWDNVQKGFLEITSAKPDDFRPMSIELRKLQCGDDYLVLQKKVNAKGQLSALVMFDHDSKGSSPSMVAECGCFLVFPIVISAGREFLHILAFDKGASKRLMKRLNKAGEARIEEMRRIDFETSGLSSVMPLINPISDLTPKQAAALAMSMRNGYYELPRHTSTGKIADAAHVPRTTFQDHRKKAETKLMNALAPYIMTHADQRSLADGR